MNEHEYEPIPGLPAPLPPGETILWQGSPAWDVLTRRAMRVIPVSIYFAILIVWGFVAGLYDGTPVTQLAVSSMRLAALAAAAVGLLAVFAWLVAKTTVYTITSRRVVMRFGIALPITIQVPFAKIDSAALQSWAGGAGDISLSLRPDQRISYLVLWPHARPWTIGRAQPTLRALQDGVSIAQLLGRALAASASQPATPVAEPVAATASGNAQLPAAA